MKNEHFELILALTLTNITITSHKSKHLTNEKYWRKKFILSGAIEKVPQGKDERSI